MSSLCCSHGPQPGLQTLSRVSASRTDSVQENGQGSRPGTPLQVLWSIFFFFLIFIFGCVGSSFLCEGFLQLRQVGATLHRGARASHCRGLSHCGAQAPDAQAQYLWHTGLVAPWHVGSSQTRARTRVPCIGRQTLNHCATREAPSIF